MQYTRHTLKVMAMVLSMVLSMLMLALQSQLACAMEKQGDYTPARSDVKAFIDKMVTEHKFDRAELTDLLSKAEKKDRILELIARPAEKVKPWREYRQHFLNERRIDLGVEFWKENKATLQRAYEVFGVDPRMIVAILGVETYYGTHQGNIRVLDSLTTLGFDYPKRSKFFLGQLEQFLLLTREQSLNPEALTGSYAGAMGYGQFIPSSYRNFAVDFDGDGIADLWRNPVDAIGCVANYFARHNWQKGMPVVSRVTATANADQNLPYTRSQRRFNKPSLGLDELATKGYIIKDAPDNVDHAMVMRLEGDDGDEYWAGYDNFYVITRYNRSIMYALAAYQLGLEIEQRMN